MTLKQFIEKEFLPLAENYRSQTYKSDLKVILEFFKNVQLTAITSLSVEKFKQTRLSTMSRRGKPLAPATINHQLTTLSKIFSLAKRGEIIRKNPCRKVSLLRVDNQRKRFLSKKEERLLMSALKEKTWLRRAVVFALHTGMRRGEIVSLKWQEVDLHKGILRAVKTKNGKDRDIPLNKIALRLLRECRKANTQVFQISPGIISDGFHAACKKAGIANMRFHDLRHTFASRLAGAGVDLVTIAELMGHSDLKQTQRYAHSSLENKRKAVGRLEAL